MAAGRAAGRSADAKYHVREARRPEFADNYQFYQTLDERQMEPAAERVAPLQAWVGKDGFRKATRCRTCRGWETAALCLSDRTGFRAICYDTAPQSAGGTADAAALKHDRPKAASLPFCRATCSFPTPDVGAPRRKLSCHVRIACHCRSLAFSAKRWLSGFMFLLENRSTLRKEIHGNFDNVARRMLIARDAQR